MSDDEKLPDVAELPAYDVDPAAARRIRSVARAEFLESRADQPALVHLAMRGMRMMVPLFVVATVSVYLTWAVNAASALLH